MNNAYISDPQILSVWTSQLHKGIKDNVVPCRNMVVKWCAFDIPQEPHLPVNYTHISEICFAIKALKCIGGLYNSSDNKLMDAFCVQVAEKVIKNFETAQRSTIINNFQSHRIKMLCSAGSALGSNSYIERAEKWMLIHIDDNLFAGGLCLDFVDRNSVKYVSYNLEPMLIACSIIKRDLQRNHFLTLNSAGVCLRDAVLWMLPFIKGEKVNIMLLQSIYNSDKKNPDYGKKWNPEYARDVIRLATEFEPWFIKIKI